MCCVIVTPPPPPSPLTHSSGGSGNIHSYQDMMRFKEETGCASVMVARAAQNNPSVFRSVVMVMLCTSVLL